METQQENQMKTMKRRLVKTRDKVDGLLQRIDEGVYLTPDEMLEITKLVNKVSRATSTIDDAGWVLTIK